MMISLYEADMRIVSWNIRAGGGRRTPGILRQLLRWQPDVVALCEFRATPPSCWLAAALAARGLAHQQTTADPRRPASNRLLVASRWPIGRVRVAAAPTEPGRWLLVGVAAAEPFMLGAIHVPNRVSGRKDLFYAGVLRAITRWRRGPAMLIGDTNSGLPDIDEEVSAFGPREERWMKDLDRLGWADVFRVRRAADRVYTWYSPNGGNGFRIDQAFVNGALLGRVRDVRYVWGGRRGGRTSLSDHAALLVDLDATARPARDAVELLVEPGHEAITAPPVGGAPGGFQ